MITNNSNQITLNSGVVVSAKVLRQKDMLALIPDDKPGWYRWWAPQKALESLLNSPYISKPYLNELIPHLCSYMREQEYFYIYVGVAINESIRDRLNWHINQRHTESAVKSGFLSTLRKTISSLVAGDQYNESATNELIDQLIVEYSAMDLPIKDPTAKSVITSIEDIEIQKHVIPLNIKGNKRSVLKPFLLELKKSRKQSLC